MNADPSACANLDTPFSQFRGGGLFKLRLGLLRFDFEPLGLPPSPAHEQPPPLVRLGLDELSGQVDVITRPVRLV